MPGIASIPVPLPGHATASAIMAAGVSMYDPVDRASSLFFDLPTLEARLSAGLRGQRWNLPIRTRSKVAKTEVCRLLGYPVPRSFEKTQPRFPAQDLDVFVQKSNNLQIWNEEVDPLRRYALIRLDEADVVRAVRVLTGEEVALLDRTGTLTTKYQAARRAGRTGSALVSPSDSPEFRRALSPRETIPSDTLEATHPTDRPGVGRVLSVGEIYRRLEGLVGFRFVDPGVSQDRNRGAEVQRLACSALGLGPYADLGQFPDILSQALEVKLQTSPTVDLGLVAPTSHAPAEALGSGLRHCDVRYAVFFGDKVSRDLIEVTAVVVAVGADFFTEFRQFEGLVRNAKLQIPLPADLFWDSESVPDEVV